VALGQPVRWAYRYNGSANSIDLAGPVACGHDGNVYTAGWSIDSSAGYQFTVLSLGPQGNERWVYRYDGTGDDLDWATGVISGEDGHIYASGMSSDSVAGSVFTVASLTSDGRERWVYRNRGAGVGMGGAHSVIWGGDGNVYAAGSCLDSASLPQFTVVSLTTDGVERWVYQYRDPAYLWGMAGRIAWGTDGQLYAAGESYDTSFSDYFTVVSLTASGTERWVYRYGEPGLAANMAMSVVVGHDGSVYVAGSIPDSAYMDFAVIGLTSAGGERWVYRLKGAAEGPGLAYSLAAGSDRNIYAAGMTFGGPYGTDFTVASLTSTGGERWVYRHARSVDSAEMASSVVWGGDGNLHAAGTCWNAGTGDDFAVISLTPSGTERWVRCYDGPAHGEDGASSIAYGADGYVYAAGSSTGIGTQSDITVAKMDASSGVAEVFGGARPAGHLGPTTVKSRLCLDRNEPAQLLDAVGRCAVQLRPGANDIRHLAPGVYFCRQQAGGETRTRKLVVQR
jgi:hypothetical protein